MEFEGRGFDFLVKVIDGRMLTVQMIATTASSYLTDGEGQFITDAEFGLLCKYYDVRIP